ncbi:MAG: hypothetical protein JW801_07540 [Bacteroidales bacterium]|nr:hypothetical protein [Bacteroidales bacterium]
MAVQGNKGKNLERMKNAGFRVPPFILIDRDTTEAELLKRIQEELPGQRLFAVRSSCAGEDEINRSSAGKYYSQIGVRKEALSEEIQKVLASYQGAAGDVIVQQFIPSAKSGVLFTNDGNGNILVNANRGLCKQVVEGHPCDEYCLDRAGKIMSRQIPFAKEYLVFSKGRMIRRQTAKASLSPGELRRLCRMSEKLEKVFGSPQDAEWCFFRSRLYLLQARPITRPLPKASERVHYDSANIAESYSGIVLPLTLSFAKHIYGRVYMNLLHASGVRMKKLLRHREIFDNMVAWHYGRLYYNMNSWYRMMAFIPGYQRNKVNLENMITSNIRVDVERDILPPFWFNIGYPLLVMLKLAYFNFSQHSFRRLVLGYISDFRQKDPETLDLNDCEALFTEFDTRLISRWHVPVENDFMVMTFFGLLRKSLTSEEELHLALRFKSKTSEQIEKIRELCLFMTTIPGVRDSLSSGDREKFSRILTSDPLISQKLEEYFLEYGGRYANELKLESKDIEEDHSGLFELLRLYFHNPAEKESRVKEEEPLKLSVFQRFLINRFRKYASAREEMRLLRSNGFSMMRKLMNRVGLLLAEAGRIELADDVYYLRLEELFTERTDYKDLIQKRKGQYDEFRQITPPIHFSLAEGEEPPAGGKVEKAGATIQGKACSKGKITGRVRVFNEFSFPGTIDFEIVVARHTDPGWTPLLGIAKGLIVEHGGILSHAAIVSRELNLPTVIGIPNITKQLKTGMLVELDGNSGCIKILNEDHKR